ncbi:odorant receptor 67c-like [Galleria mellonella]|uniref:Odorant receptor n=1 Tax=Galleria mellonella TaxID=7137 RepID=A0ABM3N367_GALME|nr:odorant receptor 67c-like [Galleria mellonella]
MTLQPLLFDESLKKIEFLFNWTGLSLESGKRTPIDTLKCRAIFIFNFIWLNSDIFGAISWFADGIENGKSFTELTYLFPCTTLSFLASMKSIIHIRKENMVNELIDDMRSLETQKLREKTNGSVLEMAKKEIRFLNIVLNVLNTFNVMMVVVFTVVPLILIAIHYLRTSEVQLMLPFLNVYPFDPYDIRFWPFVYTKQIWSECIVLLEICATDYFFYTCCTHLRIQFQLLHEAIVSIIPSAGISAKVSYDEEMRSSFVEFIKWHQKLIKSADVLEVIYTRSTLLNFVISSVVICLTGFNVTTNTDLAFVVLFLTFLFMGLLQAYFLCFFGDLLMRSSLEINEAIYNCRWYLAESTFGNDLHIVQMRSQKPCKLTAAGFADVNLRAFMRVLSSSWSYFALLRTLYSTHDTQ